MKKTGFTLAEVIITMGIIGVIAAVVLPLANKMKPDATKALYLKTYDSIVEVIQKVGSDQNIYPFISQNESDSYNYAKYPFANTEQVKVSGVDLGPGAKKFCQVLAYAFDAKDNKCLNTYKKTPTLTNFAASFVSKNNIMFYVTTQEYVEGSKHYQSDIYIDINGADEGKNCMYSATCKDPDQFKFMMSADGHLEPADPMGKEYIRTRQSLKSGLKYNISSNATVGDVLDSEYTEIELPKLDGLDTSNTGTESTGSSNSAAFK